MADDFERALLIHFNFTGAVDAALKERAAAFIEEIKRSPEAWRLCVERFSVTAYQEVKFWCLQTLHEVIRASYPALPQPAKDMIKTALLTWVTRDCSAVAPALPPFLRNKIAQTLVAVLQHEYPGAWPGFFQDLLRAMLPGSQLAQAGQGGVPSGSLGGVVPGSEGVVDMFCRILASVDEDLVSLDIPRSQDESKLSMHVKDSMREHSVADVAAAWYLLVESYAAKAPELAASVLSTMQRYINWIDIGLVAHGRFVALLMALMEGQGGSVVPGQGVPVGGAAAAAVTGGAVTAASLTLRGAAADCLAEIICKRMDAVPKLALVQSLGIVPRCAAWAAGFPVPGQAGGPGAGGSRGAGGLLGGPGAAAQLQLQQQGGEVDAEAAEELLLKLAKLLAALAGEVMDALKRVENGVISLAAIGVEVGDEAVAEASAAAQRATAMLDALFPAVLSAFRSEVDEVALPLLPFVSAYVARLKVLQKRQSGLSPQAQAHVRAMLEGLAVCARYPRDSANNPPGQGSGPAGPYGSPAALAAAKDEQQEVEEKRRDLFTLFKNLAKIAFEESRAFVSALLQTCIMALPPGSAAAAANGVTSPLSSPRGHSGPGPSVFERQEAAWQEVEVAITLLYELGEAVPDEARGQQQPAAAGPGPLAELVTALAHAVAAAGAAAPESGAPASFSAAGAAAAAAAGILPLPASGHRLVALAVMETIVRYTRVLAQAQALLPGTMALFLDARGMGHPSEDVSTRACYLFCRLVKSLRSQLRPLLPALLPPLTPHLARVAITPLADAQAGRDASNKALAPANAVVDDRLYVFEAVGLLLGQEEVGAEEQASALGSLLQPLMQQIESNLRSRGAAGGAAAPGLILQALEATVRLNKGFRTDLATRTRPQLGRMFARVLEAALAIPREYPGHALLRSRFISFLHRLVEGLQALLLPYLPAALEVLVGPGPSASGGGTGAGGAGGARGAGGAGGSGVSSEVSELADVLQLSNQLVSRFKEALLPLLEGLMPVAIVRVHSLLGPNWDWSGRTAATNPQQAAAGAAGASAPVDGAGAAGGAAVAATLEEARERGELQRAYYSLLHAVVHAGMGAVLLRGEPAGSLLEPVVASLTRGAAAHVDPSVRRTCIQVYCRLVSDWCAAGGAEAVPGFRRYAMEHLGSEACVVGVLRAVPPLDPRDGGTVALLQDAASALKLVSERCGDEFAAHLVNVAAPAAGLPPQLAQQLLMQVREADAQKVKEALRALLMQQQQAAAGGPK